MVRKPRLVVIPPQHLGHEIHVARSIVVDMICRKFLVPYSEDSLVTGLADRRFLYESLLGSDNVFDFSLLPGLTLPVKPPRVPGEYLSFPSSVFTDLSQFSGFDVVNLSDYALPPTRCTFGTSKEMASIGYDVPLLFWSDQYIELAQRFNFASKADVDAVVPAEIPLYVIVHHRYSAPIEGLVNIISALPSALPKVVFTSNPLGISSYLRGFPHVFFTAELKTYASLLRDFRCKLLFSEWSGAGQLSQYILGPHAGVWFYYDHYPDVYNFTMTHRLWEDNAKLGTYFNCWDFKIVSGCDTRHFGSFQSLLGAVRHITLNV